MKKFFMLFLFFSLFVISEPTRIPSVNILSMPAPQIDFEIQIPENLRSAEEHKFVERNGLYGAENLKGLSAFPIIIAKLLPDKIKEIAKDPWVFGIGEDIKLYATRTEGGVLINSDDLRNQGGEI